MKSFLNISDNNIFFDNIYNRNFSSRITGNIALALPLAFATIPNGGLALMIMLLMCMTYIAMQVSPTHICLAIVTEAFDVSFMN